MGLNRQEDFINLQLFFIFVISFKRVSLLKRLLDHRLDHRYFVPLNEIVLFSFYTAPISAWNSHICHWLLIIFMNIFLIWHFFPLYFLLSSLCAPSFLCFVCHNVVDLSEWQDACWHEIVTCKDNFFRLLDDVITFSSEEKNSSCSPC